MIFPKVDLIELHKASAHFPIALLMSSAFFGALAYISKKDDFRLTSYWIHLLGVISAVFTLMLGSLGNPFFEDVGFLGNPFKHYDNPMINRAVQHSWVGLTSFVLFAALAAWRIWRKDIFSTSERIMYWLLTFGSVAVIGLAGYLGAHVLD